jgi:hypothetical protein
MLPLFLLASLLCHMGSLIHRYDIAETSDLVSTSFLFFSEGNNGKGDVLKIIQFSYVRDIDNQPIFNLGFGDYDINACQINDESITDNGDVYKIFNTVLSTIPLFFDKYSSAALLVRGSDGQAEFENRCRQKCMKKCDNSCLRFNRRMKLYCNYVSHKHALFMTDYQFVGGVSNGRGWFDFEDFKPGMLYDGILVKKM